MGEIIEKTLNKQGKILFGQITGLREIAKALPEEIRDNRIFLRALEG